MKQEQDSPMQQNDNPNTTDSGLSALLTIAGFHGIAADEAKPRHELDNNAGSEQGQQGLSRIF
jgi:hypothetical protein